MSFKLGREGGANEGLLIAPTGELKATLIRKDGSHRDCGTISDKKVRMIGYPIQWMRSLYDNCRAKGITPKTFPFCKFMELFGRVDSPHRISRLLEDPRVIEIVMGPQRKPRFGNELGLVVTGGVNFLATDMQLGTAANAAHICAMNYHDSGTGTVAATSTDSGMGTQAGPATRATGTQTNPATNQYRSVGTIAYTTSLAITEWGLWSQAAQGGTLWDRRVFGAINVVNTDSVAFTYTLTLNAGGT